MSTRKRRNTNKAGSSSAQEIGSERFKSVDHERHYKSWRAQPGDIPTTLDRPITIASNEGKKKNNAQSMPSNPRRGALGREPTMEIQELKKEVQELKEEVQGLKRLMQQADSKIDHLISLFQASTSTSITPSDSIGEENGLY